jgi:hypothetical protein
MKANIPRVKLGMYKVFPKMTDREAKAWDIVAPWREQEYEAMANVMLISMLYYLMTEEGRGAVTLRRAWEGMIRCRVAARKAMRQQDGVYILEHTGKNVEDFYMREELRKKGCDVLEWEKGVTLDDQDEVHFAPWGKK